MKVKSEQPDIKANTLWDTGSTISMITFKKANKMQLKGKKTKLSIVKVDGASEEINSFQYSVPLVGVSGDVIFIPYGIQRISTPIETISLEMVVFLFDDNNIRGVERPTGEVDMLIGFKYACFHPEKVHAVDHLLLLRNMFGKCLEGDRTNVSRNQHKR